MSGLGLRLALGLYPAAYRRERADEIAGVFADTTADAGRLATARELTDLAGYGLRVRLGLSSAGVPARLAAMAAPFAAAAVAAPTVLTLCLMARAWVHGHVGLLPLSGRYTTEFWFEWLSELLFLVGAVSAVCGRWTTAKAAAALALLGSVGSWCLMNLPSLLHHHIRWTWEALGLVGIVGPKVIWVLILLAAPRDLLGPATRRRGLTALAGLLTGSALSVEVFTYVPLMHIPELRPSLAVALVGAELVLLAAAAPALLRGRYGPAAAALAGAPIVLLTVLALAAVLWRSSRIEAVGLVAVVAVALVALSRWRPAVPERRPPAAG